MTKLFDPIDLHGIKFMLFKFKPACSGGMDDSMSNRPLPERNRIRMSHRQPQESPKITDGFVFMTIVQVIVCGLILCGLFIYSKMQAEGYQNLQQLYQAWASEEDLSAEDSKTVFEQISDWFEGLLTVENKDASEESLNAASIPSEDKHTSELPSMPSNLVSDTESSDKSIYTLSQPKQTGQGGQNEVSAPNPEDLLYPPEGYTLAPAVVSIPMLSPVQAEVTSPYGYRIHPITGKLDFHTGVDLGAAQGTPILAAFSGKVTEVGVSEIYGNYIVVTHSDSLMTRYCHCEEIIAPEGSIIRQGEVLAKVGTTGMSTGPHLHFEVKAGGVYVDPLYLMKQGEDQ